MRRATDQDLLLVSKANKEKLDAFSAGESLVNRTGYEIRRLKAKVTADRLIFARSLLASAQSTLGATSPFYRSTVSRAYYSLYHTFRAVSFFTNGGDDHEAHSVLPSKLPSDFPNRSIWENSLKYARLERNRADYDPYPKSDKNFESVAKKLVAEAQSLLPIARAYLKSKGCAL
jgi:uncharacterized protein (UPF0332 family)